MGKEQESRGKEGLEEHEWGKKERFQGSERTSGSGMKDGVGKEGEAGKRI